MSKYSAQLLEEQAAVDRAYGRLDSLRTQIKSRLDTVRAAGSHGSPTQRTERDSFANMYEDRLTQLRAVEDRLVFGRIDDNSHDRRYIGRIGLSSENHDPILTDWRADAARAFYEATPSNHGNIVMRRHISLHFRQVTAIEDEVLDMDSDQVDQAVDAGTLTGEGALLASLGSRRVGKMTDIVATIQAEQDRIIRAPLDRTIVVQGGPGTGKTAVALHRAAYLLYTYRRKLAGSGVLVVGPSSAFLHYIDQVLPSLGETGVVSRTIGDLIPGISAQTQDEPHQAKLKGDQRMARAIASAVAHRERIPAHLPTIKINGFSVPMLPVDVQEAIQDAKRTRKPHNQARESFISSVLSAMRRRYLDQLDYTPEQAEISDVAMQLRMSDEIRKTLNLAWLPMTGTWLVDQLFSKPNQLRRFAPWLSDQDVHSLIRPKGSPLTIADIPLVDEAMELLGPDPKLSAGQAAARRQQAEEEQYAKDTLAQAGIGTGIVNARMLLDNMAGDDPEALAQKAGADREWTYGHIVVDEAQELTAMDWRMLIRRCPSRSLTIVGDLGQTAALGGSRDWAKTMDPLFGPDRWDLAELTTDYRNPKEVSELAVKFAKTEGLYVSTSSSVREMEGAVHRITVQHMDQLPQAVLRQTLALAKEFLSTDGSGRLAIILPGSLLTMLEGPIRKQLDLDNKGQGQRYDWREQLSICDTNMVKGLEYDAVILVQPGQIELEAPSRLTAASDLYVAMTRPTQRLVIIRTPQDSGALEL
ncbi:ATP-dependent DNA helicase [Bifidobacterium aemilianum]|uniref:ATP-dependent DNA helicase n=1 Tax=Bifidobacterium aemilianum TaxID=2493120 RepID=A0A366KA18_9BIFI|nr:AAA family ATPase [Bifidobacterium aemilianum]RBP98554.1 ATP-dependent DNA helicase [Bifidobacterium aemilianum]